MYSENPNLPAGSSARGEASSLYEMAGAAFESARVVDNSNAASVALERAYDQRMDGLTKGGVKHTLVNPVRMAPSSVPGEMGEPVDIVNHYDEFDRQLHELARKPENQDKLHVFKLDRSVREDAREMARQAETRFEEVWGQLPSSFGAGYATRFAMGMAGAATDPINIAALGAGPWSRVGIGAKQLLWNAAKVGAVNAGAEVAISPFAQSWRKEAGLDYGLSHVAFNVASAFGFGALADLGIRGAYRGVRRGLGHEPVLDAQGKVEGWRRPARPLTADEALDAAARAAAPTATVRKAADGDTNALHRTTKEVGVADDPAVRGARQAAEIEDAIAGKKPAMVDDGEALESLAQAFRHATDEGEPPARGVDPVVPARSGYERIADGGPTPPANFKLDGKPVSFREVPAGAIGFDAERFQFKGGGNAEGVNRRLAGVAQWDPIAAGRAIVYERADGSLVVADGHQRLGLAKRLEQQGHEPISLPATVFREADGWTPADVRAIAARKNLQEGSGDVIDAARVIRERPDIIDSSVPLSAHAMRQARNLARLSDEAFAEVLAGRVAPNHAAIVGDLVDAKAEHLGVIRALAEAEPNNEREARHIIADMLHGPRDLVQEVLLSGHTRQALLAERAQVLDRALKLLREDEKIFALLSREAERISGAGNVLAVDANALRALRSDMVSALLETVASRPGPVRTWLDEAALRVANGVPLKSVAKEFADDVRNQIELHGLDGLKPEPPAPLRGRGIDDPAGAEAKAQIAELETALEARLKSVALKVADDNIDRWMDWQRLNKREVPSLNPIVRAEVVKLVAVGESVPDAIRMAREQVAASEAKRVIDLADAEAERMGTLRPEGPEDTEALVAMWQFVDSAKKIGKESEANFELAGYEAELKRYGIAGAKSEAEVREILQAKPDAEGRAEAGDKRAQTLRQTHRDDVRTQEIERQTVKPEEVESILDMWRFVEEVRKTRPPETLAAWLRRRGGVQDPQGDVKAMLGAANRRPGLISRKGRTLDDATLSAWEEGFLGGAERPTINDLLDALDDDLRGNMIVREADRELLEDIRVAQEMENDLAEFGIRKGASEAEVRTRIGAHNEGLARQSQGRAVRDKAGARPEVDDEEPPFHKAVTAESDLLSVIDKAIADLKARPDLYPPEELAAKVAALEQAKTALEAPEPPAPAEPERKTLSIPGLKPPPKPSERSQLPPSARGVFALREGLEWTGLPQAEFFTNLQHIVEKRTEKDVAGQGDLSTAEKVAAHIEHVLKAPTYAMHDAARDNIILVRLGEGMNGVVVVGTKFADRGRIFIPTVYNQEPEKTLRRLLAQAHQQGVDSVKWQKAPERAGEILALLDQAPPRDRKPSWHQLRRQLIASQADVAPLKAVVAEEAPTFDFTPPTDPRGVARRDVQIGATRIYYEVDPDGGVYLGYLKTFPDARNLGSARNAMEAFFQQSDDAGRAVSLVVMGDKGMDDARLGMFYASLGFREQPDLIWVREPGAPIMRSVRGEAPLKAVAGEGHVPAWALEDENLAELERLWSSSLNRPEIAEKMTEFVGRRVHDRDIGRAVATDRDRFPDRRALNTGEVSDATLEAVRLWQEGGLSQKQAAKRAGITGPGLNRYIKRHGLTRDVAPLKAVGGEDHLTFGEELGTHADIRTNFPDADFWIVRKGSEEAVGSVTREFSPEHIGVLVRNHNILPDYLYYAMMHAHSQGYFKGRSHGTLRLKNIKVSDVKGVPVDGPMYPDIFKAVAGDSDGAMQRAEFDRLGFYSRALEAAKVLKQEKGTPEQMLAMLRAAGVKEAEIRATGLDKFLAGVSGSGERAAQGQPAEQSSTPISKPPANRADYIDEGAYKKLLNEQYFKEGKKLGSSREVPVAMELPAVGSWRISPIKGIYGHDIEQLVRVKIAELDLPELEAGRLDPVKRGDDERYAQWLKEGKRPPPIEIVETEHTGKLKVMDGHRRVLAAKLAGNTEVEAWVSRTVAAPHGRLDSQGRPIMTGLTFEIAQQPGDREGRLPGRRERNLNQVTRSDIVSYLRNNRVEVREGVYESAEERLAEIQREADAVANNIEGPNGRLIPNPNANEARWFELKSEEDAIKRRRPKWSRYSLDPSNPTYRETVIHLEPSLREREIREALIASTKRQQAIARELDRLDVPAIRAGQRAPADAHPLHQEWQALRDRDEELMRERDRDYPEYRGGHFTEGGTNALFHARTSLQKDSSGKPVFLIDELQSDWGQKLREGGVRDEAKIAELKKEHEETDREIYALRADFNERLAKADPAVYSGAYLTPPISRMSAHDALDTLADIMRNRPEIASLFPAEDTNRYGTLAARRELLDAELRTAEAATPGHPLVSTTDQWTTTALRRLVRQAVEAGAESIAIIPGKVAADRFNLSRHVDGLMYLPPDPSRHRTEQFAYLRANNDTWQYEPINNRQTLEEFVGKELAQKLRDAPPATDAQHADMGWREIPDLGSVEIGGHGMRATYDGIYPRNLLKILQKLDPSIKQEEKALNSSMDGREFKVKYSNKRANDILEAHGGDVARALAYAEDRLASRRSREAQGGVLEHWEDVVASLKSSDGRQPILFHTFPLTEKVKASVMEEGQPLFAAAQRTGRDVLPEDLEEGAGAGDWIDTHWEELSRRESAAGRGTSFSSVGEDAKRVVQRIVPKSALELEAEDLFPRARAREAALKAEGRTPAEIAEAMNAEFGGRATADDLLNGRAWWRADELAAAEKKAARAPLDESQLAELDKVWSDPQQSVGRIAEHMSEVAGKPISKRQIETITAGNRERYPSRSGIVDRSQAKLLNDVELAELDRLWNKTKLSLPEIAEQMRELFRRSDIHPVSISYQARLDRARFPDRRALNPGRQYALFWTEPRLAELERIWGDPAHVTWTAVDMARHMSEATGREVTPEAVRAIAKTDRTRFPTRYGSKPWSEGERRLASMAHMPANPLEAAPLLSELFGRRVSAREVARERAASPTRPEPTTLGLVPDELVGDSLARAAIDSRVAAGAPIAVRAGIVDRALGALAPHLDLVPEGFRVGVLARVEPLLAPAEARRAARSATGVGSIRVRAVIRNSDGTTGEIIGPWHWFKGARAVTIPDIKAIVFFRAGMSAGFDQSLRSELWHELVHALRKVDAVDGRVFALLVGHANRLRILDMKLNDYLEKVGRSDAVAINDRDTLRSRYDREYRKPVRDTSGRLIKWEDLRDKPERINQEAVAHLVELIYHRALPIEDIRPIAPLLRQLFDGRSGHASRLLEGIEGGKPLFAVVGRQARSADLMLLDAAQRMERAGRSEGEIFKLTNWYREGAGQWASERSDIATALSGAAVFAGARKGQQARGRAETFLRNAHQLEDYPELRGISVTLEKVDPRELPFGEANLEAGTIHVSASTPQEAAKKLVVELHRFIARLEGMAEGGTPASALEVVRRAATDLDQEAAGVLEQLAALPRLSTAVRRAFGRNEAEQALLADLAKLQAMRDELESLPMREAYRRLGGTVAGRNIEKRFGWTQEMRAAMSPLESEDTRRSQQLIARGPARQWAQDEDDSWEKALWETLSQRSHRIQEAVDRKEARPVMGGQSAYAKEEPHPLQKAVAEFERAQMAAGRTAEEVAAAIEAQFGFPVDPVAVAKREVWWRIDDILDTETGGKGRGRSIRWRFEDDAELARVHAEGMKLDAMVEHMAQPQWLDRRVSRAAIETRLREKGLVAVQRKGPLSAIWTDERNALLARLHEELAAEAVASAGRFEQRGPARVVTELTERLQADIAEQAMREGQPVRRLTERSVKDQMRRLGIERKVPGVPDFWTTDMDALLTRLWRETPTAFIGRSRAVAAKMALETGREISERVVLRRLMDIGVIDRSRGKWTPEMVATLTSDEIAKLSPAEAAAVLSARFPGANVSRKAIIGKRNRLAQDLDEQLREAERLGVPVDRILEEDLGDPARVLAEAERAKEPILETWRYVRDLKSQPVPERLWVFLRRMGGIRDEGGDLTLGQRGQAGPGLLNKAGMSLDDATLRAWEAGYLTGAERPAINDLLEALSQDLRGQPVVRQIDKELWDILQRLPEMENELARYGLQAARTEAEARQTLGRRGHPEASQRDGEEGAGGAGGPEEGARGYRPLGDDEDIPFFKAVTAEGVGLRRVNEYEEGGNFVYEYADRDSGKTFVVVVFKDGDVTVQGDGGATLPVRAPKGKQTLADAEVAMLRHVGKRREATAMLAAMKAKAEREASQPAPVEGEPGLIERAVRIFGLTDDPKEAGYILPDGKMLDFTGRAQAGGKFDPSTQSYSTRRRAGEPDWMAGRRDRDHRELGGGDEDIDLGLKPGSGFEQMHEFMDRAKAIRYMAQTGGFDASFVPTDAQLRVILRAHAQHFRGEPMTVDFSTPTGERIRSVEMERPTLQKLKEFFQEPEAEASAQNRGSLSLGENEPFKAVTGEPQLEPWRVGLFNNHGKPFGGLRYYPARPGREADGFIDGLLTYRSFHGKKEAWHPVSTFSPDELRAYLGPELADHLMATPARQVGEFATGAPVVAHELTGLKKGYLGDYWEANKERARETAERRALEAQRDREWEAAAPARAEVAVGEAKDAELASHLSELVKSCKA